MVKKSSTRTRKPRVPKGETEYKLMNTWEAMLIPNEVPFEERKRILADVCELSKKPFPVNIATEMTPMTPYEEFQVAFSWFFFFSVVLYGPFIVLALLFYKFEWGVALMCIGAAIAMMPAECNPALSFTPIASLNLKYFSYRAIWKETLPPDIPYICVTPPHGLFPIGGLLGVFAMPRFTGFFGRGIAATAVLNVPVLGNLLRSLGCIDASRQSCDRFLQGGSSIGISSGGIAEIFETNTINGAQRVETIILSSRGGICKMALQNGVDIIPGELGGC